MWLGKLTALDMTPLGRLGRKTSTQTKSTDDTLKYFFLFLPENRLRHVMRILLGALSLFSWKK